MSQFKYEEINKRNDFQEVVDQNSIEIEMKKWELRFDREYYPKLTSKKSI